jgi:uncharacterized RDD family membrane protein YckC
MTADDKAPIVYATFSPRLRAAVYDGAVRMVGVAVLMVVLMSTQSVPGAGVVAAAGVIGLLLLYEPLMVWRSGATLGHRRCNVHVVDDATGEAPTFIRALARFGFKTVLNAFNFYPRFFGVSDRALHDQLTNTSVRIRDLQRADPEHYFIARSTADLAMQTSASRRVMMIVGNVVILAVVCTVGAAFFISADCVKYYTCAAAETRAIGAGVTVWVLASALMAVAVWRARARAE